MSPAFTSSIGIVAYLALFLGVAVLFVFASLLIGRFVRPANPQVEKSETYECGEPTIGSSFVQFDLRFYVVALLFIIFDVEVAFFFPWAAIFGKAVHLSEAGRSTRAAESAGVSTDSLAYRDLYRELGIRNPAPPRDVPRSLRRWVPASASEEARSLAVTSAGGRQLALITLVDILVFFGVLLVGFAYVWNRGDLDWVRALTRERARSGPDDDSRPAVQEQTVLSV
jgi:NADH-quinone oxidoreductase subunit A